jgi:hypothetical protein
MCASTATRSALGGVLSAREEPAPGWWSGVEWEDHLHAQPAKMLRPIERERGTVDVGDGLDDRQAEPAAKGFLPDDAIEPVQDARDPLGLSPGQCRPR